MAVLCFDLAGAVHWREAVLVGAGAICGGYEGAHLGRQLPVKLVHLATVTLAALMTMVFFWRGYD